MTMGPNLTPPLYFRWSGLFTYCLGCQWADSSSLLIRSSRPAGYLRSRERGKMSRFSLFSLRFRLTLLFFLAVLATTGLWLYGAWVDSNWQPPHLLPYLMLGSLLILILAWLGSDWFTLQRVD